MNEIALSICIPTYNFGAFISETLDSILCQTTDQVEILIYDGASTDDTEQIVKQYQQQHACIHYKKGKEKGGIDADMCYAINMAKGKYFWLFSADDLMKKDAIRKILSEIKSELDVYLCGLTLCSKNMSPFGDHKISNYDCETIINLSDEKQRREYFSNSITTTAFFSFMSSLIIKKERWDNTIIQENIYFGTCWAHAARIFSMIKDGLIVKYIPTALLYKRGDNDSFMAQGIANRYRIAIDGYNTIADNIFGNTSYETATIRRTLRNEITMAHVLVAKYDCIKSANKHDIELLDRLIEKLYCDNLVLNRFRLFVYYRSPTILLFLLRKMKALRTYFRSLR